MEFEENQANTENIQVVPIPNGQVVVTIDRDGSTKIETTQNEEALTTTSRNGSFVEFSSQSFGLHATKDDEGDALIEIQRFGGIRLHDTRDAGGLMDIGQEHGGTDGIGISFFPDGDRWVIMENLEIVDSFRGGEEVIPRSRNRRTSERQRSQSRHARSSSRRHSRDRINRRSQRNQSQHRPGSSRHR